MQEVGISAELLTDIGPEVLRRIEAAGRTCYKSEAKITADSAPRFVAMLIQRGHDAMLEHGGLLTARFIVPRGVSHELVRHRLASFAQESTRYCDYARTGEITVIRPCWLDGAPTGAEELWRTSMALAEDAYQRLRRLGVAPELARGVLPTDLKTEVVISANPREWRHLVALRTTADAHPQCRAAVRLLLPELRSRVPVLFDDVGTVGDPCLGCRAPCACAVTEVS